jgi:DNA-binding beta-propeller fold protein YncE
LTSDELPLYGGRTVLARARGGTSKRGSARLVGSLIGAALLFLWATADARAADRLYVANEAGAGNPLVSFVNLDGGGGDLVPGVANDYADGAAIDAAAGRLYYGRNSSGGDRISFVNLDGSGGGDLSTPGVTVNFPNGLAIDPAAGMLYFSNYGANEIAFARLDGSGAGTIDTTGATLQSPIGVAIDPAAGRIYWANNSNLVHRISFANLDGSGGGGDLNTSGASNNSAWGLALDVAGGKVYWGNGDKISFAGLDGSGGGDLPTTGVTVSSASGVAIDVPTGRLYWADSSADTLSFAGLDGSGGGTLPAAGASLGAPSLPVLLKSPAALGSPAVTGAEKKLSCSQGTWAPDLLGAFLYRAPQSFSYQWSRNGAGIPEATESSFTAGPAGNYRCRVTAQNQAGSASQTSEPYAHFKFGKVKRNKRRGTAKLPVTVPGGGTLTLTGKGVVKQRAAPDSSRSRALGRKVGAAGTVKLLIKAKGKRKRKLNRKGKVKVKVKVAFTPAVGTPSAQTKKLKLKKTRRP